MEQIQFSNGTIMQFSVPDGDITRYQTSGREIIGVIQVFEAAPSENEIYAEPVLQTGIEESGR